MINRSPSGGPYPFYHKGGEISIVHYSGYGRDKNSLEEMMKLEGIHLKATKNSKYIMIETFQTVFTSDVIDIFVMHLKELDIICNKLALVGLNSFSRILLRRKIKKEKIGFGISFFTDIDAAKDWLVSE